MSLEAPPITLCDEAYRDNSYILEEVLEAPNETLGWENVITATIFSP